MIHPFEKAVSVVGAIVLAVMFLTVFFKVLGWFGRRDAEAMKVKLKGILDEQTLVTIHLNRGATLKDVRVAGFTDWGDGKTPLPHGLVGMMILERFDGGRTLIRANQVRMIETAASAKAAADLL